MAKVRVTMGTAYCGCPSESIEFEVDGSAKSSGAWEEADMRALEAACCGGFANYFLSVEVVEDNEDFEE